MKSMTGFGRGAFMGQDFAVTVELKTVNNRFLDVNLRLSQELNQLEATIKRQIGNQLSRGGVDVNLTYERAAKVTYELTRPLTSGSLAALKQLKEDFSLTAEP